MTAAQGHSRLELCLLGGLLGDAWGGAYEGRLGPIDPEFPKIPAISDDTQLVIATCEAIIERSGAVDPGAVAGRFRDCAPHADGSRVRLSFEGGLEVTLENRGDITTYSA